MAVHLIETSEEDSYLAVARHISDLLNEGQVSRRPALHHLYAFCHIQAIKLAVLCVYYQASVSHRAEMLVASMRT